MEEVQVENPKSVFEKKIDLCTIQFNHTIIGTLDSLEKKT